MCILNEGGRILQDTFFFFFFTLGALCSAALEGRTNRSYTEEANFLLIQDLIQGFFFKPAISFTQQWMNKLQIFSDVLLLKPFFFLELYQHWVKLNSSLLTFSRESSTWNFVEALSIYFFPLVSLFKAFFLSFKFLFHYFPTSASYSKHPEQPYQQKHIPRVFVFIIYTYILSINS